MRWKRFEYVFLRKQLFVNEAVNVLSIWPQLIYKSLIVNIIYSLLPHLHVHPQHHETCEYIT